jgi:hypothetical protein
MGPFAPRFLSPSFFLLADLLSLSVRLSSSFVVAPLASLLEERMGPFAPSILSPLFLSLFVFLLFSSPLSCGGAPVPLLDV